MTLTDILIFIIPLISGYVLSSQCPMNNGDAGKSVPSRPPSWVFGVAWPILYILMGLAWVKLRQQKNKNLVDILFVVLVILLNLWIYIYSCKNDKKSALYILLLSILSALTIWGYSIGTTEMFYLTPLVVWLIFATMLNFTEVNNIN